MGGGIAVYIESGRRRVFACAVEWPGWCRSGRGEEAALESLLAYGPRYARALGDGLGFTAPRDRGDLEVVERVQGGATTDFGAPEAHPSADHRPLDPDQADRQVELLRACWAAFDRSARAGAGHDLRKGPRGGGRELDAIVEHLLQADRVYLRSMGGMAPPGGSRVRMETVRSAFLEVFRLRARGEPAPRTPRSGNLWTPRYAVRRSAWHALDHAWEIEDRLQPEPP